MLIFVSSGLVGLGLFKRAEADPREPALHEAGMARVRATFAAGLHDLLSLGVGTASRRIYNHRG